MDGQGEVARRDEVLALIGRAVEAPSSHNTQPWRFRVDGATVELWADRTRALPVNDPDDRELAISCGCALQNLLVAASADGFDPRVELLPDGAEADLVARVSLVRASGVTPARAALLAAIRARRTYRKAFDERAVPGAVLERLVAVAAEEGAVLEIVDSASRREALAAFVAEGDAVQWSNAAWRRELAMWMHPRRAGDGLVVHGLVASVAQAVVRTFDLGGGVAASDRKLADASPVLAVLSTPADTPRDRVVAGLALQRVLLEAVTQGVQASFLNQPVQVAWIRPRLESSLRVPATPQLVVRMGFPVDDMQPTPRRALEAVVD